VPRDEDRRRIFRKFIREKQARAGAQRSAVRARCDIGPAALRWQDEEKSKQAENRYSSARLFRCLACAWNCGGCESTEPAHM
jgi:hypothetical protein